nr:retrovirus-related Pol polyprotein from transposon TNT 1-94 [Tanacetum cinerariifolium]
MFLWAEDVAIACYTQNRSFIHTRHNKTPYELVHDRKPDLKFLHIFGALCYPINDSEDLGKLRPSADIGIFVGYAPNRKGYRIYNKRTRQIMETIHVQFDELTKPMAPEHIIILRSTASYLTSRCCSWTHYQRYSLAQADNDLFVNMFALKPSPDESSSGDVSSAESTQVVHPHNHLRK